MKQFTNLYQVSKTLRFELQPIGKTKETFKGWLEKIDTAIPDVDDENLFLRDKKIKEAYLAIKPIMDSIHEEFIEKSLSSKEAKNIDFSDYYSLFKEKKVSSEFEKRLRKKISDTYSIAGDYFISEIEKTIANQKRKSNKKAAVAEEEKITKRKSKKPFECLTDVKMLFYLSANVKRLAEQHEIDEETLSRYIQTFKGFWGYLDGYNQNRENYYESEKETSTAVATRIVNENLPTFCNNILRFEKREKEYLNVFQYLKNNNRETKIKNSLGEEEDVVPIRASIFKIEHFNECLTQSQIEEYNRVIGNYNLLINLYNQLRSEETEYREIDEFEKLRKQIGCGKKPTNFDMLHDDSELKELLQKAGEAGEKMFGTENKQAEISTLPQFVKFLKDCNNWEGIYMSKAAINIISSLYFANWHSIEDKLYEAKAKACITYDKNREEPIQLRDAVELSELFAVLDTELSEHIFKDSLFKKDETNEYQNVLDKTLSPSKNLINLLCCDIEQYTKSFLVKTDKILALEKFKNDTHANEENETVKIIREWFVAATNAMRIVRFFAVRKSKMKGKIPNVAMEHALDNLLYCDNVQWFKWYDLVRNYLTKKPQDDVKENKLKLNFGTSSLLDGWSDGQEKTKAATLLKYNNELYLCILKTKNIFDTSKEDNPVYQTNLSVASRLILRNLKFQTLAGKGFLSENDISYSEMGAANPSQAILCLQKIIKERYVSKYPQLEKFVLKSYTDKGKFDAEISDALKDCYVCEYMPIDWNVIIEKQNSEELFLFKICCKDIKPGTYGRKDLQTMYWEDVLSEGSNHQLCAGAEIFMREPISKESPVRHRVGSKLVNKRDQDGNTIPEHIYREIYSYANGRVNVLSAEAKVFAEKSIIKDAKYEIIKDKRFYGDTKFMFHCPIKLFFKAKDPSRVFSEVNTLVNDVLQESTNLHFIGIDRGEKHLVYSCAIDKDARIVKCIHHDIINGTDYVQKLEAVADERIIAKKNWQEENKIKDLKKGYISHVVHRLVEETIKDDGMISPHAYIILEDLSTSMKRGRQKIEKQVYQNLEMALAKKLNFVVDKTASQGELGSVSMALQLTPPVNTYQDIEGKKQFGVMLYTRANYTSITDPATGWRKTIYIKDGKEDNIRKDFISKFTDWGFDGLDYYFEYKEENVGHIWRMYSGINGEPLPRFQNRKQIMQDKNIWVSEQVNVVDILDNLFARFDKSKSLKEQLEHGVELQKINGRNETAWQSLRYAINVIQQIRNSGDKKSGNDNFLYSPVRNAKGEHFDTRNHHNNGELSEIKDADANGAFNIARKGLIMDAHIKYWNECGRPMKSDKKDEKTSDLDLFISDREWDMWLLDRSLWEKELPIFASLKAKKKQ